MDKANKVRRALRVAIDRETIITEIQSGLGRPLYNTINAFPGDEHWDDAMYAKYNADEARTLLSEAGYPD